MLDEQGKSMMLSFARGFLKYLGNFGKSIEQSLLQKFKTDVIDTGKMSMKSFLRSGGTPAFAKDLDLKTVNLLCAELKKQGLKFSVIPEKDALGNSSYKLCYDARYVELVNNTISKCKDKLLENKKESLENRLKRAKEHMKKDMQTQRSEPLKHKEVGAR